MQDGPARCNRLAITRPSPRSRHAIDHLVDPPREPVHARVAERDGRLVGLVHFLYHRSTTLVGPTCYLQDLFTLDSERGKGVGRALIEAVYDAARQQRAERVYWQTHETNHTAMRLYDTVAEKTGFAIHRKVLPR